MKSMTFYVMMMMIKIVGIKKVFLTSPLNYARLRARDVHVPSRQDVRGLSTRSFSIQKSTITEIAPPKMRSNDIILYCPGGSFVSGPAKFNWRSIAQIVKNTGLRAYMIDYPKAPEHQIEELNQNIDAVYKHFVDRANVSNILLLGGSVGGTLMTLLVQRLVKERGVLPKKLILITPMIDCSMNNARISDIESKDIMYARNGVKEAGRLCAGSVDLKNEQISPLSGSIRGMVPTLLFIAENDIHRPDAELFYEKLKIEKVDVKLEFGKGLSHIWPLLPMREGKRALGVIADYVLEYGSRI